ncbi:hypothetical protein KJ671_01305 [Patescibacteria group bacterium]|nr:hypothetical protein [Patescibacteria group bacterium]
MKSSINKKLDKFIEKEIINELLREFKNINSIDSLNKFFDKFLTDYEKCIIFRRIATMKLLNQNKKYCDIKKILNVSANTISKTKDILEGRRYSKNPNRKRKYSTLTKHKKIRVYQRKYKGAENILNIL